MSFKDKLIKKPAAVRSNSDDGNKTYFPETIGIYCEENPDINKRQFKPKLITVPPHHKTGSIEFKEALFSNIPYWMGTLVSEPLIINVGYFPPNALYTGTDKRITNSKYETKIPILQDIEGLEIPLTYDTVEPVVSERKRLYEIMEKVDKDKKEFLQKKLDELKDLKDEDTIRVSHNVKTIPKIFIPILTSIEVEVEDEDGELVPHYHSKIVIFEETLGVSKSRALHANQCISSAYDTGEVLDYLYSDIDSLEMVGKKVLLFRNPYSGGGKNSSTALAVKEFSGKVPKALQPYFPEDTTDINVEKFKDSFLRIAVLEMIQLFSKKGDVSSLEGQIKEYFWSQIRSLKEDK